MEVFSWGDRVSPQILSTLVAKLYAGSPNFYRCKNVLEVLYNHAEFLADRTIGRAFGTLCRLSVVCQSVTFLIVTERYVYS